MDIETKVVLPIINNSTKIEGIFAETEFSQLSDTEKSYAYYLSKAAWEGSKICYFQSSKEAPGIFILFQYLFSEPFLTYKNRCIKCGISEEDWNKFCFYFSALLQNCGNYLSFGDTKFIPDLSKECFHKIITCSNAYSNNSKIIDDLWSKLSKFIFCYEKPYTSRGFTPNGLTGYYSSDITKEEATIVNEFLQIIKLDPLNTRVGKIKEKEYIVKIASVNQNEKTTHFYKENTIHISYGEFSSILRRVNHYYSQAINSAANKTQKQMLQNYIRHFNTGDVELHKESQRNWVKDVGPIIESDFGFIETYQDPCGVRAEFEGFVAIVNKKQSEQTNAVVNNAERFLQNSPWPREFEMDKFLRPDFTSLAVLTFACSGTPIGINIPNYDDIRQEYGFKNVYLGNCLGKPKSFDFLDNSLSENLLNFYDPVMFHVVVFHELLGHGCGKLLMEDEKGVKNFDPNTINPLTGKPVETWYKANETCRSVFGKLYSSYEECRADSVALYYCCFKESTDVLQSEYSNDWVKIMEGVFTEYVFSGLKSLQYYDEENKEFQQAHVHASYSILQVLLEAGDNFITIEKTKKDEKDWISVKIDNSKILTTGLSSIKEFLKRLNIYKAVADFKGAEEFFRKYSLVNEFFLDLKKIIIANKKPRKIELQGNIYIENNEVNYEIYPETTEGVINSFKKRFSAIDSEMHQAWEEALEYMPLI